MVFDKDYNMLKALERSAKSRTELCDGTNAAYSRLTRLIERGLIIPEDWEPVPGQETSFRLTGEGRAYIQDVEAEHRRKIKDFIITVVVVQILVYIIKKIID